MYIPYARKAIIIVKTSTANRVWPNHGGSNILDDNST